MDNEPLDYGAAFVSEQEARDNCAAVISLWDDWIERPEVFYQGNQLPEHPWAWYGTRPSGASQEIPVV